MRMAMGSRDLEFRLGADRRTVEVVSTCGAVPVPLTSFESVSDLDEAGFAEACAAWLDGTSDAELKALRVGAGAYPLVRTDWDGYRCRVSVTVPGVGAAAGVVRVAEEAAARATGSPDMVETDRTGGQRTGEGLAYGFVFEHFDKRNADQGVSVEEVGAAEFRCVNSGRHESDVAASVRVRVPVAGRRERVSLTLCRQCWAEAVVDGLRLDQYDTGE